MAYDVTKTIAGRAYRYRVESVRDPVTGRRRSRWTYLGRTEGVPAAPRQPRPRGNARERLLDALARLLAARDFEAITADAIAVEAGLAHGTFYRHFRDKRDALRAALERVREQYRVGLFALRDDVPTLGEARAQLRGLVDVLRTPPDHPGLLRAVQTLSWRDPELARQRRDNRAAALARLAEHLAALRARGFADVGDPEATAAALLALLDGLFRDAVLDGVGPDAARIAAAADVIDRAVFPDPTRNVVA